MQAAGKVKRKFAMKALPDDEHPHFLRYATELAAMLRHTIFVDRVVYSFSSKSEVLELLEEHITENIVKVCRLCNGISNIVDNTARSAKIFTARWLGYRRGRYYHPYSVPSSTRILNEHA
ncbi:hypothetical protein B0F90DRAFT_1708673 [Multifurca ochricompacta]|uniref:Uncharacterized protein n=1 Tax=Multifurca ochricompacta TaxID=376703 RepID=A0AAD4M7D7_9AGAM|nr:hypothetical protein B0F90DRAFT_1708673 [Multifurca ochricompacta]